MQMCVNSVHIIHFWIRFNFSKKMHPNKIVRLEFWIEFFFFKYIVHHTFSKNHYIARIWTISPKFVAALHQRRCHKPLPGVSVRFSFIIRKFVQLIYYYVLSKISNCPYRRRARRTSKGFAQKSDATTIDSNATTPIDAGHFMQLLGWWWSIDAIAGRWLYWRW